MEFIKKTLFKIIPITTLIIFLSYGISVIFGDNLSITYLYEDTNTNQLIFNWKEYLNNLATFNNIIRPFENLGNSFNMIKEPIDSIINLIKNTKWWKLFLDPTAVAQILVNTLILLTNIPIWLLNISIAITQAANVLLGTLLKLIGINTNADIVLFNIFRGFDTWNMIPGIPALTF